MPVVKRFLFRSAFIYPRFYAFFAYYRKEKRRREFEEKVALYYGRSHPREIKTIVRGVFELRGIRKIMRYLIPHMDRSFIEKSVNVENREVLDKALQEGRGILLMAGHLGVPHLAFNALRAMGYDVILLSGVTPKRPKRPGIRYYDTEDKTIFVHDLSRSESYKKRILETLQSGKIVYYDGDAAGGRTHEKISFLGQGMEFPTGMLSLAHRAHAAVVPFIHLFWRGKMDLIFKDPVEKHWLDGERAYRRILLEFAQLLESYVLAHPEQYLGIYGPTVLAESYRVHGQRALSEEE